MFEGREDIVDIGRQLRLGHAPLAAQRHGFLADGCEIGEPFAIPAIEGAHRIARSQPQHAGQIMPLFAAEDDFACLPRGLLRDEGGVWFS